jgi:hypothetical protein
MPLFDGPLNCNVSYYEFMYIVIVTSVLDLEHLRKQCFRG